jgi:hypothetical protein
MYKITPEKKEGKKMIKGNEKEGTVKEKTAKERYKDQSGTRLTENDIYNILYSLPFTFVGEVFMKKAPISFNEYIKNHIIFY